MQLVAAPLPLSPLARTSRRSVTPTIPATETVSDHVTDSATSTDPATSEAVATPDPVTPDPATWAPGPQTQDVATQTETQDQATADPASTPGDNDELTRRALELKIDVHARLNRDGRWTRLNIAGIRDDMMRECTRGRRMSKVEAQIWTYGEIDRLYPPEPSLSAKDDAAVAGVSSAANDGDGARAVNEPSIPSAREADSTANSSARASDNGNSVTERVTQLPQSAHEFSRLQGLGDVPPTWLPLPANASLEVEIRWVQANRLYVVEERGNTTIVHLDRAHEPAPSRAAIGWLETSIRSYAKYVDVVGKYLGVDSDEASVVRRERMAIAEIRALLDEMHAD